MHRAWERRHPYNFVCLVDVTTVLAIDNLRRAAVETLLEFGLWSDRDNLNEIEVVEVPDLEEHARRELNATLANPVRLAIRSGGAGDREVCAVAFTYRHLFFDGTSSTVFLRRTLIRANGEQPPLLQLGQFRRGRDFLMENGLWRVPGLLGRLVLDAAKMRSVYARGDGSESPECGSLFVDYRAGLLDRLRREGDRVGATVNDVLLARMARATLVVDSLRNEQRCDIAISMAVSLRNGIEPLDPGVCVAVCPVFLRRGADMLRSIQKQTNSAKQTRSYMKSLIGIGIGSRLWRDAKTGCRASNVYVPSLALTNMRVPAAAGDELIVRWRRVVAAGPMAPLLVTALTHSNRLEISLSWRKDLFSAQDLATMVSHICR